MNIHGVKRLYGLNRSLGSVELILILINSNRVCRNKLYFQ